MYCIVWFGVRARRDGFVRRRAHCHPTQLALLYSRDLREDQAKFVLVSCAAGSHNLGQQLGRERTFHAAHDANCSLHELPVAVVGVVNNP
mmetsp:Transcript_21921/g.43525  ORF Transcript_21921/g.43525 Transcript_21921/m.43525 type:complete len:90 (+) Transcript_21921:368-637(+)